MATYTYQTSEELMDIESDKIEALTLDSPIFKIFPIRAVQEWKLRWTVAGYQGGLQQLRGLDVASQHVERFGLTDYEMEPGVYGEHMSIRETELAKRAQRYYPGGGQGRVDIGELIMELQDELLDRRIRLLKYIAWNALFGTFSVASKQGAGGIVHTDTFNVSTYDASTWATVSTATPLLDFRTAFLTGRGKNVNFGRGATAFANLTTIYNALKNTNANDLGGRYVANLTKVNSVSDLNTVLLAADLPPITPMEEGYYDSSNTFQLFVPDGKVVIISGDTAGSGPVGEYRMTYQVVTDRAGAPSPYQFIRDTTQLPQSLVPPMVTLEDGHTGGPVVLRPWKVLIMDVS